MAIPEAPELERLKRASNRAALVSALGVVLVVAALGFGGLQLRDVQREVGVLETRRDDLRAQADRFRADADRLRQETKQLEEKRAEMQAEIESLGKQWDVASRQIEEQSSFARTLGARDLRGAPISLAAEPRAASMPIGEGLFLFRCWLSMPTELQRRVAKVSYFFNHPTFVRKVLESRDSGADYGVEYQGWGALDRVIITVEMNDGTEHEIAFNMLAALSGSKEAEKADADARTPAKGAPTRSALESVPNRAAVKKAPSKLPGF